MRRLPLTASLLLAGSALLACPAPVARAESTALLTNGQRITGTVPVGEVIRLRFKAAAGSEPRINFALAGSPITLSFPRTRILDPDGAVVPDTSQFFAGTRLRPNKSILKLREFVAQKTGVYTLLIETNSANLPNISELRASGRYRLSRPKRERFTIDENDLVLPVALLYRDQFSVKVKQGEGGVPAILKMLGPDSGSGPSQEFRYPSTERRSRKKGAVSPKFRSIDDDVHTFEFGFRNFATAGTFTATVKVNMYKLGGVVSLRLENAPGIPLSVRPADRFLGASWGSGAPGLAYDAVTASILVTALYQGTLGPEIAGRLFTTELGDQPGTPNPVLFVGPADMQPGEQLSQHRLVGTDANYYVAWTTFSGAFGGFSRIRINDLGREGFSEIPAGDTPIRDPFLATDGTRITLGLFRAPVGHNVRLYEADLSPVFTVGIGGGALSHANGAGVAWDEANDRFQLWAPDTLGFGLPSDLHRQYYDANWQSLGAEEKPIADQSEQETMSTAVSIDPVSGATIIHYVVPAAADGSGEIRRAIFDADGVLVPGSDLALFGSGRNRPTSLIVGNRLFLGYESAGVPTVERFPILR